MVYYRRAKESDIDEISKLLAQSFKNYCLLYETLGKLFNNDKTYEQFLYDLYYIVTKIGIKKQIYLIGVLEEKVVSLASIQKPYSKEIGIFDYLVAGGLYLLKYTSLINIFRFLKLVEDGGSICKKLNPDAWYIEFLVVNPNHQGRDLGSDMIKKCIQPYVRKQGGKEISLITNSEINRKFYTKNGFKEVNESIIKFKRVNLYNWSYHLNLTD